MCAPLEPGGGKQHSPAGEGTEGANSDDCIESLSLCTVFLCKLLNVLFSSERYRRGTEAHRVETENLVVTAGSTSGLHLVSTILMEPGAVVFVEDPTYFIALEIFAKDLCFRQGWQLKNLPKKPKKPA